MKKINVSEMENIFGGLVIPCFAVGMGAIAGVVVPGLIWFLSDDIVRCWNS